MLGYERVKKAVEFSCPDRMPLDCSDRCSKLFGWRDCVRVACFPDRESLGDGREKDEWGVVRQRPPEDTGIENEGQVVEWPLIDASLEELKKYPFPDSRNKKRYSSLKRKLAREDFKGKYVLFENFYGIFQKVWELRGEEKFFLDFYDNKEFLHKVIRSMADFQLGALESLKPYAGQIHGFHMGDDLGSQNAPLISPKLFREFLKPHYKEIIDYAHSLGMHVWLHSDGKINDLIDEFIDIGLDALEINSPNMLGIDEVSKRFRGKICFMVCVDIQKTLPKGNKDKIEAEVKELVEKWGTEKGGIVALDYYDWKGIGVNEEKVKMSLDAFLKHGKY